MSVPSSRSSGKEQMLFSLVNYSSQFTHFPIMDIMENGHLIFYSCEPMVAFNLQIGLV